MGKAKGDKKGGKASATPVCNCEHPFQCDCGNRPERPSRGHKWDPVTKQWGGKGHKVKGASLGAAHVGTKELTVKGGTKMKQWEKAPSELVAKYLKDKKKPSAAFKNLEAKGKYRFRIILRDGKNQARDLVFVSSTVASTETVGREEACLLALSHVCKTLPLEKQLGEPYRSQWLGLMSSDGVPQNSSSSSSAPAVLKRQNKFISSEEEAEYNLTKKKAIQSSIQKKENKKAANKDFVVDMTRKIRKQVESVVDFKPISPAAGKAPNAEIKNALRERGFTDAHSTAAATKCATIFEGICHLIENLKEEELPEKYKPGDGGGLSVVAKAEPSAEATQSSQPPPPPANPDASLARQYGIPENDVDTILKFQGNSVFDKCYEAFARFAPDTVAESGAESGEEEELTLEEQLEALAITNPEIDVVKDKSSVIIGLLEINSGRSMLRDPSVTAEKQIQFLSRDKDGGLWEGLQIAQEILETSASPSLKSILAPREQSKTNSSSSSSSSSQLSNPPTNNNNNSQQRNNRHRNGDRPSFFNIRSQDLPPAAPLKPPTSIAIQQRSLPARHAEADFVKLLDSKKRVLLVAGATGCGKSTQVPQIILSKYPTSKICVTQPRRLAATGVANRVAQECGSKVGGVVGYAVKGDSAVHPRDTRILFCTIGVLLRSLSDGGPLKCIDWLVVDEVHERSLDTDVLLGLIKRLLADRSLNFRVCLMSATMDEDKFTKYFTPPPPTIDIPGRTFPVTDLFVKDALEVTGYIPPKQRNSEKGDGSMASLIQRLDPMRTDYDLIGCLVREIVKGRMHLEDGGSVLVFLPGLEEISRAERGIRKICSGVRNEDYIIFQLHGGMKAAEQNRIFQTYPNKVKIVLSTNVAQTSITIPDCVVVIDSCLEKQSSYDANNRMPLLLTRVCSQDALNQRRGRAGRVREGVCYKLVTRKHHDGLSKHSTPEIERVALDSTILTIKAMNFDGLLKTLISPPSGVAVNAAVTSLKEIGALEESGAINNLGRLLSKVPTSVVVAKLMIMGVLLSCRDFALTIAAGMALQRSPFLKNMEVRKRKQRKKRFNMIYTLDESEEEDDGEGGEGEEDQEELDKEEKRRSKIQSERTKLAKSVGHSDHSLLAAAYERWDGASGGAEKRKVCEQLGLSEPGMREFKQMRQQLDSSLSQIMPRGRSDNANSKEWRVVRTVITSALCPVGLVKVEKSVVKYDETAGGNVEREGEATNLKFFRRGQRVFVHPSSGCFHVGQYSCPWLANFELVETSKPFLRDVSECTGYGLLFFGGKLDILVEDGLVQIGGFARLAVSPRVALLVKMLRRAMDEIMGKKIDKVDSDIDDIDLRGVMYVVSTLLIGEGL
ncbi:hypothetical protein TrVE_jg5124 [Triparma verrucosa]|uniref:Uncharacterized protein n=1 Tax=Triparma verrucosa TaxID=1606542 RepID=A0A9W7B704_9STRA|nr:hypothetical protein TrVE_jg5124 [Triparma verrucosa]